MAEVVVAEFMDEAAVEELRADFTVDYDPPWSTAPRHWPRRRRRPRPDRPQPHPAHSPLLTAGRLKAVGRRLDFDFRSLR